MSPARSISAAPPSTSSSLAGFHPAAGRKFEIIANDGADPIHGRFAGLHQGDTLTVGSELFRINYHAHGNDVVLTALGPVPAGHPPGWVPPDPASDHSIAATHDPGAEGGLLFV